ncbi:hypothetical protein [Clavibacter michiganensis]|uniref:Uncharacterized protein n=1 Tax=Clavibacter michiganensis subsp. insidiosus TaxID=33014 RepID=A0A0D5CM46_9MICO|nr:hypothetical protein [Clavibacter michiganensis]AJW80678.1 hypothetical protein VO01_15655 [Clavibacter michiganensis subsp. insidiosus]AWF99870.1 hypothetical protein BEH61_15295 [Clavibacter michiganensis subsp. insidiosus]OQJ57031.1 hypothetical protein B5P21_15785 [Clavibacter michiganensis subsp. insidiosus]RIJ44972.1 hypothetical protein DZF93_00740 [Clavibacter michiganensis subsp. insidiosus]RMC83561.1 hypothetical protein CmiCFBP2404_14725 [Clavibacter michiganensis subsp. insidios
MSDGRLHTNAPPRRWRRRGLLLIRNTAAGFVLGVGLWVLALLFASAVSLVVPDMGPGAAAGAWETAWAPSGYLFTGTLLAGLLALVTIVVWWQMDQLQRISSMRTGRTW